VPQAPFWGRDGVGVGGWGIQSYLAPKKLQPVLGPFWVVDGVGVGGWGCLVQEGFEAGFLVFKRLLVRLEAMGQMLLALRLPRETGVSLPFFFFFTLVTGPSLKLSDTRVYQPQIGTRLGTTVFHCRTTSASTAPRTLRRTAAGPPQHQPTSSVFSGAQGYLAHKKQPTPLGPP